MYVEASRSASRSHHIFLYVLSVLSIVASLSFTIHNRVLFSNSLCIEPKSMDLHLLFLFSHPCSCLPPFVIFYWRFASPPFLFRTPDAYPSYGSSFCSFFPLLKVIHDSISEERSHSQIGGLRAGQLACEERLGGLDWPGRPETAPGTRGCCDVTGMVSLPPAPRQRVGCKFAGCKIVSRCFWFV